MEAEILHFIEMSGGVSPIWLPKTAVNKIAFPPTSKRGLDKTDKILLSIGIVAVFVALIIFIYRTQKSSDKLSEEIKKFDARQKEEQKSQLEKEEQKETELEPK